LCYEVVARSESGEYNGYGGGVEVKVMVLGMEGSSK
jgi:hypothetical protein